MSYVSYFGKRPSELREEYRRVVGEIQKFSAEAHAALQKLDAKTDALRAAAEQKNHALILSAVEEHRSAVALCERVRSDDRVIQMQTLADKMMKALSSEQFQMDLEAEQHVLDRSHVLYFGHRPCELYEEYLSVMCKIEKLSAKAKAESQNLDAMREPLRAAAEQKSQAMILSAAIEYSDAEDKCKVIDAELVQMQARADEMLQALGSQQFEMDLEADRRTRWVTEEEYTSNVRILWERQVAAHKWFQVQGVMDQKLVREAQFGLDQMSEDFEVVEGAIVFCAFDGMAGRANCSQHHELAYVVMYSLARDEPAWWVVAKSHGLELVDATRLCPAV